MASKKKITSKFNFVIFFETRLIICRQEGLFSSKFQKYEDLFSSPLTYKMIVNGSQCIKLVRIWNTTYRPDICKLLLYFFTIKAI